MGDYVKKALLNLKDFEQGVIENYQEKYQLNKQQAEHNKKILQNFKKQLDTAKKQLEVAKKIEYETEYQNSKLKDIL